MRFLVLISLIEIYTKRLLYLVLLVCHASKHSLTYLKKKSSVTHLGQKVLRKIASQIQSGLNLHLLRLKFLVLISLRMITGSNVTLKLTTCKDLWRHCLKCLFTYSCLSRLSNSKIAYYLQIIHNHQKNFLPVQKNH